MIPILYKPDAKTKIGWLAEASDCQCTEERNGVFELEFLYPMLGRYAADLVIDRYVKAKPNATAANQFFHIRKVSKPINGMFTVSCEHISYALSGYPVPTVSASGNAQVAINAILTAAKNQLGKDTGFSVATTDITLSSSIELTNVSARAALGGVSGSVLDIYGGEYKFDNYTIKLYKARGKDRGVRIAYGRNMTELKCDIDMDSAYTGIYGYVKNDNVDLYSYKAVTNSSGINAKTLIRDFSSDFSGGDSEITQSGLDSAVSAYAAANDINSPTVSMTVSFVDLSQSPEYASFSALESVSLCDTVQIYHKDLNINIKAKVIKTVYDVLRERYTSIDLGSPRANFADVIKQTVSETKDLRSQLVSTKSDLTAAYEKAIADATAAITGNSGGYVRLNPSQNPQEILIMDTPDISTAKNIWRFNLSGFGHSSGGYSGPYGVAITQDGHIVADFIDTGILNANIIRAGILQSTNSKFSFNLETGHIEASDINITGGDINIKGKGRRSYYLWLDKDNASKYSFKSAADYAAEDAHKAYIDADWVTPESYPQTEPYYIQVSGWANCKLGDSFRITGAIYNRSYNVSTLDVAVIIAVDVVDAQGNKSTVNLYSDAVPFSSNGYTIIDTTVKVNAETLGSALLTPTAYSVRIGTFVKNTRTLKNVTAGWYAVYNLVVGRTTTTDGGSLLVTGSDGYTADLSSGVLKLSYKSGNETQQFFNMANTRIYSDSNTCNWYSTLATGDSALVGDQRGGFKFGTSTEDAKEYVWMDTSSKDPHADLRQNWFTTFALMEANAMTIRKQVVTNPYCFDVFAGLLHHRYVDGKEHTVGVGIGAPGGKASAALELTDVATKKILARSDIYQNDDGEVTLKLTGTAHVGYITVKNSGIWVKLDNGTEKKIT